MGDLIIKYFSIFLFGFVLIQVQAQEVIPASGGNGFGSGGSVSYTIGQVSYTTNANDKGSVEQGIQHGYIITVVSDIDDELYEGIACIVYPNPTSDYLTLEFDVKLNSSLAVILYNIQGRELKKLYVIERLTDIPMEKYVAGNYLLNIIQENELSSIILKTFKIVKK